jgi:hypothetical protein
MARVSISTVTEAELRFGIARKPEATRACAPPSNAMEHRWAT